MASDRQIVRSLKFASEANMTSFMNFKIIADESYNWEIDMIDNMD